MADAEAIPLRVTKTRRTDETSPLHYSGLVSEVAICGAVNQGRALASEQRAGRRYCWTCVCLVEAEEAR